MVHLDTAALCIQHVLICLSRPRGPIALRLPECFALHILCHLCHASWSQAESGIRQSLSHEGLFCLVIISSAQPPVRHLTPCACLPAGPRHCHTRCSSSVVSIAGMCSWLVSMLVGTDGPDGRQGQARQVSCIVLGNRRQEQARNYKCLTPTTTGKSTVCKAVVMCT